MLRRLSWVQGGLWPCDSGFLMVYVDVVVSERLFYIGKFGVGKDFIYRLK